MLSYLILPRSPFVSMFILHKILEKLEVGLANVNKVPTGPTRNAGNQGE